MTSIPVTFGSPSGEPNPAEIIVEGGKFGESNTNLKGGNEVALGDDGGRGKVTVKGGAFHCSKFSISGNTAPESNGYIDFLRIEGGAAYLRQAYNYSTATARVMVAGGTYYSAHQWYGAMFQKGRSSSRRERCDDHDQPREYGEDTRHKRRLAALHRRLAGHDHGKRQSAEPCCVLGTNVWFDNVGKVKFSGNEKAELSGAHFGLEVTEILFDNSPRACSLPPIPRR